MIRFWRENRARESRFEELEHTSWNGGCGFPLQKIPEESQEKIEELRNIAAARKQGREALPGKVRGGRKRFTT